MGFECALAIVLPSPGEHMMDTYPSEDGDNSDGVFFDRRKKVVVPAREWEVFRFIDFGRVRTLVKETSGLSPSDRAEGGSAYRARTCAASFLLAKFFQLEEEICKGNIDFVVPFIADHMMYSRSLYDADSFVYSARFKDIFERLSSNDVVTGLWSFDERYTREFKIPEIKMLTKGAFFEYNMLLLSGDVRRAVALETKQFFSAPCGLVWHSAHETSRLLTELLLTTQEEGVELRKDPLSCGIVRTWRDTLQTLSQFGARVIFLTGSFHMDARCTMRTMSEYL